MFHMWSGKRDGEKGLALIMAIGFLAILSILGAVVLQVATRDLGASGVKMPEQQVFYASDRAVEYSMTRGLILNMTADSEVDLMTDHVDNDPSLKKHFEVINTPDSALTKGKVSDLGPNDMPSNISKLFGDDFGANYYHVEVKAVTPPAGTPRATSNVNASIVRLFKRDDDTIFRTTRGG